ncbi:hypothetical protein [Paenibacillus alkalitolerans]|uniref:hypothetical protein n=1 Tax=Paenibacillus alkalitolerans TaxID=2799335 RepID=UPI0018F60BDB|nr:hypothetical protein [Paenibacillus alkalitolerans]
MHLWLRLLTVVLILFSISSLIWFFVGSTAYFQRMMDIIGTTILIGAGVPVLVLAILYTILSVKGWTPTSSAVYVGFFSGLLLLTLLSASLIHSVNSHGWMKEKIASDTLKITEDGKYEYRIELINLFQRNSRAQLYLKDVGSGEEKYIPVDIQTRKIAGLGVKKVNNWVVLEPAGTSSRYILYTTRELGIPEEKFEIDIMAGISSRLD